MKKTYFILIILAIVILIIGILAVMNRDYRHYIEVAKEEPAAETVRTKIAPEELVAHAGGAVYGFRRTNSLEAINNSYNRGFKFFELDFEWTKDGYPVLIHDWDAMVKRLFMSEPRVYSLEEFHKAETFENFTLLDMEALYEWLLKYQDAHIVTDIKKDNVRMLTYIKTRYPGVQKRIIPQIYQFEEYEPVRELGYENIILTLYCMDKPESEIVKFAGENELFAVTMDEEQGFSTLPNLLKQVNTLSYVYTINDLATAEKLKKNGVFGIYTDYFEPAHWPK
jgi:glycerophosphoryl diester phosphodiesterase